MFAGFGRKEQFPAMVSYFTSGVLENVLKRSVDRKRRKINADSGPAIMPFAQDRMVHTLVRGIDPDLRYQIFNETLRLTQFPGSGCRQDRAGHERGASARLHQEIL